MTTLNLSPAEPRDLVPIGGALIAQTAKYIIELVGGEDYYNRPWYKFNSNQVRVDHKHGILQFKARPSEVTQFIWELVFKNPGKGNPVGMYVDVFVKAYKDNKVFAQAALSGHIIVCNNVGPKRGYIIEVQAKKDIEVEYYD